MRMRNSLAQIEREFEQEALLDRQRREQLRRQAIQRTRVRRKDRIEKHQKLRFLLLLSTIAFTVVAVTWAMFQTLAWLMG
jgi:Flp pilus assembly protein TadB